MDEQIKISKSVLDNMIWMSYRYCIGRHSIAAWYHAEDILTIVKDNMHILSKATIEHYAKDIREQIKWQMKTQGDNTDLDVWKEIATKLEQLAKETL